MEKYKEGDIVKVKITKISSYGAFAYVDEEYNGLIHISEITDKFVRSVNDYFEIGDEINAKVIEVCNDNQLKLSIKDVENDLSARKNRKLKETVFGFYLLKQALPKWVDEKLEEINKKS